MNKIQKLAALAVIAIISAGCGKQSQPSNPLPSLKVQDSYVHKLKIGRQNLMVEIASTPAQMEQGLSGRQAMDDNQGMLFDFGTQNLTPAFWMKDMKFNLDFIWISGGKVAGVTANVAHPDSSPDSLPTYRPPFPINQVLEVNAGWAKKNNIATGDDVVLQ